MQRMLVAILFLIIAASLGATSAWLAEGFEATTFPPANWTVTASSWTRSTSSPLAGAASAFFSSGGTVNGKQLRTPKLSVGAASPSLSFKAKRGSSDRGEQIRVGYSAAASGPYAWLGTFTLTSAAATYSQALGAVAPGDYYFVLETLASNTGGQAKTFYLDDVAGPELACQASLNLSSWTAGTIAPGEQANSGNSFILSNLGGGVLTVVSVSGLAGTDFNSTFNAAVALQNGQSHAFGFSYDPLDYGSDNASFQIVTTGGTVSVALSGAAAYIVLSEDFESYPDFTLAFPPWTQYDGDQGPTYPLSGVDFPNEGYFGSFIIFNPATCNPPQTGTVLDAHGGTKYAACFDAVSQAAPNNDWLISPVIQLSSVGTLSFWARSITDYYGLERFRVLYSTTDNAVASFTNYVAGSATTSVEAPPTWTQFTYQLPQNARYFAIQCVSYDIFLFYLDDIRVSDLSTPPPPSFGHLSGHVFAAGTSTPIANALVQIGTKQALTDASGYYLVSNLVAGTYSASCSAAEQSYRSTAAEGILIQGQGTSVHDFYLTWGELIPNPSVLSVTLAQGQSATVPVLLGNPGGTAATHYTGSIVPTDPGSTPRSEPGTFRRLEQSGSSGPAGPVPDWNDDRATQWLSYASTSDADIWSALYPERGNFFRVSDLGMVDGGVTISQLRHYFFNPATEPWGSTYNKFHWKVYSVDSAGTVSLLHTSAEITLPADTPIWSGVVSNYTLPAPLAIPAGCNFLVSIAPVSNLGRPHSLVASGLAGSGYHLNGGVWTDLGMNLVLDAYVTGDVWLGKANFSGTLEPGASASLPLSFNAAGINPGTKQAWLRLEHDARLSGPSDRGEPLYLPISLTVTDGSGPLAAPQNPRLTSISSAGSVTLAWDAVPGATTYRVYAANRPYSAFEQILSATANQATLTLSSLLAHGLAANRVFFRVTAE